MFHHFKLTRARNRTLHRIDTCLATATILSLAGAIAVARVDAPHAVYLLVLPAVTIIVWACSGLVIDRQALQG